MSNSLQPHELQHAMLPCPSLSPEVCSNSYSLTQWCRPTISSSVTPVSCLHSFPESGSFPVSWLYPSGGQSIGASASTSALPMNIQGWFPLQLTGIWSPCSPRDTQESSPAAQLESINSSVLSFFYDPTLTSAHYWKNHSFDLTDLCWQSNISAF